MRILISYRLVLMNDVVGFTRQNVKLWRREPGLDLGIVLLLAEGQLLKVGQVLRAGCCCWRNTAGGFLATTTATQSPALNLELFTDSSSLFLKNFGDEKL